MRFVLNTEVPDRLLDYREGKNGQYMAQLGYSNVHRLCVNYKDMANIASERFSLIEFMQNSQIFSSIFYLKYLQKKVGQNYKPTTRASLSKGSMFCNDRNSRFAFKDFFLIEFFSHQDHKVAQMKLLKIQRAHACFSFFLGGGGTECPEYYSPE